MLDFALELPKRTSYLAILPLKTLDRRLWNGIIRIKVCQWEGESSSALQWYYLDLNTCYRLWPSLEKRKKKGKKKEEEVLTDCQYCLQGFKKCQADLGAQRLYPPSIIISSFGWSFWLFDCFIRHISYQKRFCL